MCRFTTLEYAPCTVLYVMVIRLIFGLFFVFGYICVLYHKN